MDASYASQSVMDASRASQSRVGGWVAAG